MKCWPGPNRPEKAQELILVYNVMAPEGYRKERNIVVVFFLIFYKSDTFKIK